MGLNSGYRKIIDLFSTADDSKLDGIEAGADVTDEENVIDALDGATLTAATLAVDDKVLIQDTDDSDTLKTVTTQAIADLTATLSTEETQDIVGAMFSGNTETLITATYQDADGTIDLVVDEASINLENLTGYVANEHIDWTSTTENLSTSGTVDTGALGVTGNITVSGTVDGRDIAADGTKLDGVETAADVTDATNVDAAGAVMNSDSSTASMSFVVDEDDMTSNSATLVPTQQSTKAYVDSTNAVVRLDSQTASGTSVIEFTGLSSTYQTYEIRVTGLTVSVDAAWPNIQTSSDGGSNYDSGASDYSWELMRTSAATSPTVSALGDNADTMIRLTGGQDSTAAGVSRLVITISDHANASGYTTFGFTNNTVSGSGSQWIEVGGGHRLAAGVVDAIQIIPSSGNFATGVFTLYGIK